jgi:DNA-binding response OmpR family regulator
MERGQRRRSTILVVDDEPLFGQTVAEALEAADYRVETIDNGHEALVRVLQTHPDLILLDIGLPDIGGMDLCGLFRQHAGNIPIIFLTAHRAPREIVAGLEIGADDYITKPCDLDVLLARVHTALRRTGAVAATAQEHIAIGDVVIDKASHQVHVRGTRVELSPKEFNLLWLLMREAGRVIPRLQIIDAVWGVDFYGDVKALDVYIRLLRRKIEADPDQPHLIQTVRGVGYMFAAPEIAAPTDWHSAPDAAV